MRALGPSFSLFFLFNPPSPSEIYTLSLHDALPIYSPSLRRSPGMARGRRGREDHGLEQHDRSGDGDRKSTRLNSSHITISYAVFCLKKKKRSPHAALPHCDHPTQTTKVHTSPLPPH